MTWFRKHPRKASSTAHDDRPSSDTAAHEPRSSDVAPPAAPVAQFDSAAMRATVERVLDPYDNTASLSYGSGRIMLDPGQILANTTELMERFQLDPFVPIGLGDIADDVTLYAFFKSGMAEVGITHLASEASRILSNEYPSIFPARIAFSVLDTFDPREAFDIPEGAYQFEPLDVTRQVMRDYLDPSRTPRSTYDIDRLSAEGVSAVMLSSLFAYAFISNGCRSQSA